MDFTKIIEALKGAKWYLVLFVLIAFTINIFREELAVFLSKGTDVLFEDYIVEDVIDRDAFVNELLNSLMMKSAADRAYVFRFHNGQNYFDGAHKVRLSCEYEVVDKGIEPQADRLRDIPASIVGWFLKETIEGRMYYADIDSIPDIKTRLMLEKQGIRSIAVAPYYNHNGRLTCLIGVDYVARKADIDEILKEQYNVDTWDLEYQKGRFIEAINEIGETISYYDGEIQ